LRCPLWVWPERILPEYPDLVVRFTNNVAVTADFL